MKGTKKFAVLAAATFYPTLIYDIEHKLDMAFVSFLDFEDFIEFIQENINDIDMIGIDTNELSNYYVDETNNLLTKLSKLGIYDHIKRCVIFKLEGNVGHVEACLNTCETDLTETDPLDRKVELFNNILMNSVLRLDDYIPKSHLGSNIVLLQKHIDFINFQQNSLLEKKLNLNLNYVTTTTELFKHITKSDQKVSAVIIELNKDYDNLDFSDVVSTVKNILQSNQNTKDAHICGLVTMKTDLKLLRKSKGIIKTFCVLDNDFTDSEKEFSISCALNDVPYMSTKLDDKLKNKKQLMQTTGIKLTPRQLQVLELVADRGASNKLIGKILKISESTVKLHLSTIFKKYGVTNRTQLALCYKKYAV